MQGKNNKKEIEGYVKVEDVEKMLNDVRKDVEKDIEMLRKYIVDWQNSVTTALSKILDEIEKPENK